MAPPSIPPPNRNTGLTPDKNFVDENWDEDSPIKMRNFERDDEEEGGEEEKEDRPAGVQADQNFATEDWD